MLLDSPRYVRMSVIMVVHAMLFIAAYAGAFMLRFDFALPELYASMMFSTFGLVLVVKMAVFFSAGQYAGWWRYVGLKDLLSVVRASALSTLIFVGVNFIFLESRTFPRSIYLLDLMLTISSICTVRVVMRLLREKSLDRWLRSQGRGSIRLLIVGAGDTAEMLLREVEKNVNLEYRPVALLDDDPRKQGLRIHNVPVVGTLSELADVVERLEIGEIIIATPSATRAQIRELHEVCAATGLKTRILPAVENILDSEGSPLGALREVAIEDLLGRDEVVLDEHAIASYVAGKTVLVTGAGGSIGSEICRQICRYAPTRLVMVEQAENPLFFINRELIAAYGGAVELVPVIADICESARVDEIFERYRPEVVLHAAAHKHVPLMEANPGEAVRNNILGTRNVTRSAARSGSRSFVLISTDKAINPTSVMGTTKRVAELYVQGMASAHPETQFIAVRFGNVLGSNGSVIPIFKGQIEKGGPVTVTHPEMERFFMTIPEATQLVLQAATSGASGQVFVLDMGEPVKIIDLARDMIRLSGLKPGKDIEIVFTGIRPGEKLFEELGQGGEGLSKTEHDKIFIGNVTSMSLEALELEVPVFFSLIERGDATALKTHLKELVPEYSYTPPRLSVSAENVISIERSRRSSS